jgi:predicted DNA-binding protein YlxM (UPF0122 family)
VQAKAGEQPWHVRLRLQPLKDWMTLGEVAEALDISRQAVHKLVERGTLSARTLGNRPIIVVNVKSVQALPMSPQRRRKLERLEQQDWAELNSAPELGEELPGE